MSFWSQLDQPPLPKYGVCRMYPLEKWMRNNLYPWNNNVLVVMSSSGEARYSVVHTADNTTLQIEGEIQPAPVVADVKIDVRLVQTKKKPSKDRWCGYRTERVEVLLRLLEAGVLFPDAIVQSGFKKKKKTLVEWSKDDRKLDDDTRRRLKLFLDAIKVRKGKLHKEGDRVEDVLRDLASGIPKGEACRRRAVSYNTVLLWARADPANYVKYDRACVEYRKYQKSMPTSTVGECRTPGCKREAPPHVVSANGNLVRKLCKVCSELRNDKYHDTYQHKGDGKGWDEFK